MLVIFGSGRVKADQLEEVCEAIREYVPKMQGEKGTLEYFVYQQKDDPQRILFFEKYRDQEAKEEHNKNPGLKKMMDVLVPAVEGESFIAAFKEIAVLER
jgi:quinol monooxygenase YgiN